MKKYYFEISSNEKEVIDQFINEKVNYTVHYVLGPYENKTSENMIDVFSDDDILKESFLLYIIVLEKNKEFLIPLYCFSKYEEDKIKEIFFSVMENDYFVIDGKKISLPENISGKNIRTFGVKKSFSILEN